MSSDVLIELQFLGVGTRVPGVSKQQVTRQAGRPQEEQRSTPARVIDLSPATTT